jgi:hypothetical protein
MDENDLDQHQTTSKKDKKIGPLLALSSKTISLPKFSPSFCQNTYLHIILLLASNEDVDLSWKDTCDYQV